MSGARALPVALAALAALQGGGMAAAAPRLEWTRLPDVAAPGGLKGMYGGVSGDRVLLAGGSNFPVAARAGGKKTFHAAIHVRSRVATPDEPWVATDEVLPSARGEGAAVTALGGVIAIGGATAAGPLAEVLLLRWEPATRRVAIRPLPELPGPAANAAAAVLDGWLYVAGGEGQGGALASFRRLELATVVTGSARWEPLPSWPGRPRFGGVLVTVMTGGGVRLLWAGGIGGPAKNQADYFADAFLFAPATGGWTAASAMPRGAVLAAGIPTAAGDALVLGGSDGHDFHNMKTLGERYRIPSDVLHYDGRIGRWSGAGMMPLGLVGAAVVPDGEGWWIAGGEYSPGLRTPQVHRLRLLP